MPNPGRPLTPITAPEGILQWSIGTLLRNGYQTYCLSVDCYQPSKTSEGACRYCGGKLAWLKDGKIVDGTTERKEQNIETKTMRDLREYSTMRRHQGLPALH